VNTEARSPNEGAMVKNHSGERIEMLFIIRMGEVRQRWRSLGRGGGGNLSVGRTGEGTNVTKDFDENLMV
jgi:hypothetical protein